MIQMIPMLIGLPFIGFWFWMFMDMTNNPYLSKSAKNNWFAMFLIFNVIAAAYYYLVEYRPRNM
jgi:heme/copper-type cytochrome/quinol oxidase subunit 4